MIPLDYQTPEPPKDAKRKTSATVRFACGVGMGCLGLIALAALAGEIDIPIGPACSCVMAVAIGGGIFWVAGWCRKALLGAVLVERNKALTFAVGVASFGAFSGAAALLPNDSRIGAWIEIAIWAGLCVGSHWIAVRRQTE